MGGQPANVDIWDSADVWIHRATKPNGDPWTLAEIRPASVEQAFDAVTGAEWELVGLLNGENGFAETVAFDESAYNAWGYGEILKSYRNRRLQRVFTALERNSVTEYLESPGDTEEYVVDAKPARVFIGFEVRTDVGKVKRRISTVPATVMSGGRTDNEQDMAAVEYTASIFPDALKRRFLKQETGMNPSITAITVTPDTAELDLSDAETQQLTVTDSNSVVRTASATYHSSATGVATVSASGLVTPVSVGTATIVATYGGHIDLCDVTVIA
ncbi:Ig-like domain-containing protein [Nocardia sp. CA-290969]|uniref:Ig-like domain-containing protein n=1 Tax=Nocardia sp. CA-290969 TaxID=3239986 RepID=UPI003D929D06